MSEPSSSTPAPAEVTANSVVTAPHPPSDSAPPPTSIDSSTTSTALPARTYTSQPAYPSRTILPPAYAPNSSVPNFLRTLSTLLFLGGTISAAVAWFYKSVVIPRLILTLKAKVKLFGYHQTKYLELWQGLKQFTESKSCERLGGKDAIEFRKLHSGKEKDGVVIEEDEEKEPLIKSDESQEKEEKAEEDPSSLLPQPPQLLVPLTDSLKSLSSSLSSSSSSSAKPSLANPSNLVQPQGQLMRSFVTFNEYLESELQSINTSSSILNPYRSYGTTNVTSSTSSTIGGGGGGERKVLQEATQGFKAEIRSIKGALLNRRNFVRPEVGVGA
ncbi:hypothetical protein JCM5350_006213 [Sporobolomyces pararoseus]